MYHNNHGHYWLRRLLSDHLLRQDHNFRCGHHWNHHGLTAHPLFELVPCHESKRTKGPYHFQETRIALTTSQLCIGNSSLDFQNDQRNLFQVPRKPKAEDR